jgi:hypothetical protein
MSVNRIELIREKFPELLSAVECMSNDRFKPYAFSNLIYTIKDTQLLEEKFSDILNTVER